MLHMRYPRQYPWEVISNQKGFDYIENRNEINKKMENAQKTYPVLSAVRIIKHKHVFSKKSIVSPCSKQIFYIYMHKRPLIYSEPILIKVIDVFGKIKTDVFHTNELKKVNISFEDKPIISRIVDTEEAFTLVNIEGYPRRLIFKILTASLSNYRSNINI